MKIIIWIVVIFAIFFFLKLILPIIKRNKIKSDIPELIDEFETYIGDYDLLSSGSYHRFVPKNGAIELFNKFASVGEHNILIKLLSKKIEEKFQKHDETNGMVSFNESLLEAQFRLLSAIKDVMHSSELRDKLLYYFNEANKRSTSFGFNEKKQEGILNDPLNPYK